MKHRLSARRHRFARSLTLVLCCTGAGLAQPLVAQDEPIEGRGDGNTEPDILGADLGTGDYEFQVRAERSGGGNGRVYTVVYRVTDAGGLSSESSAEIVVPHDQAGM